MQLDKLRGKIDHIDQELLRLFEARMETAVQIAAQKKKEGLPLLDRKYETEKIAALVDKVSPDLEPYAHILYDTLFELSRYHQTSKNAPSPLYAEIQEALQHTPALFPQSANVAYQGVAGAYSQFAVDRLFKRAATHPFKTFESVFAAIDSGFCKYGVLPLENSTAGSVTKVYTLMQNYDFKIVRSLRLKVNHNLVAQKGVRLEDIREIFSHEQALAQCAEFLEQLGPEVKITSYEDTAAAAETVAKSKRHDIAAICSYSCVELYDLHCLARDIQDRNNNYTRFICISKNLEIYPGADRSSIMMVLPHTPGALYKTLARFYALGMNLNKLESRPLPNRDFQFMFYFDLETPVYSEALTQVLRELNDLCDEFYYLGSYNEVV